MQDQSIDNTTSSFSCPSFSSYASNNNSQVANIAAKVALDDQQLQENDGVEYQNDYEDSDFEFVSLRINPDENDGAVSIKAVDGGGGGEQSFPLFDRSLLHDFYKHCDRDRDADVASSSTEDTDDDADDLEGLGPGTYCVWKPAPSPARCKKSNSTGSSSKRKWRLRDLLRRSSSDGGARGMRRSEEITSSSTATASSSSQSLAPEYVVVKGQKTASTPKGRREKVVVSAHEEFYVRSKAKKEGEKRKSYLPYRQGLVGLFATANSVYGNNNNGFGLARTFPPF